MASRAALTIATLMTLAIGWIVSASFIYLQGIGRPDAFVFPYNQWWPAFPYWSINLTMMFWIWFSAFLPSAFIILITIVGVRHRIKLNKKQKKLYGETGFADPNNSTRNKILTRETPYR